MSEQQTDPQVFNFMPAEDHEDAAVLAHLKEHYNENAFEGVPPSFFSDYVVLKCREALSHPVEYENKIVSDMIDAHDKLLLLRSMTDEEDLSLFDLKSFFNATILKLAPEVRKKWEAYKQNPADKDEIIGCQKKRVLFGYSDSTESRWDVLANVPSSGNSYGIMKTASGIFKIFIRFSNDNHNRLSFEPSSIYGDNFRYAVSVPIPKDATEAAVIDMIKELMIANGEKNIPPLRRKANQPA